MILQALRVEIWVKKKNVFEVSFLKKYKFQHFVQSFVTLDEV
jgi:hypothetical protein